MNALHGVRVVDLTHVIAGPFCTFQLAVMGADVIKIESPHTPDQTRATSAAFPRGADGLAAFFTAQNANKRAIALDLKCEAGRAILRRLLQSADVFAENYRSGAMRKLGLDYAAIKKIKRDIIYCSLTGFGQQGDKGEHTAYDNVIQAFSGLMSANGDPDTAPIKIGPPVLDYATGIQAAFAIVCALHRRGESGEGAYIDVAMLDAALMLMSSDITYYQQVGELKALSGNMSDTQASYGCYDTAQGQIMIGAYTGAQFADLWRVLGDAEYGEKFRGATPPATATNQPYDTQKLASALKTKTADEWERALNKAKVPAARVRKLDETLRHAQLNARDVLQAIPGDESGRRYPAAAFKFAEHGAKLHSPPPVFAEHTREVLDELGYAESEIEKLAADGVIAL